ncbi:MAG: division/cell wall cluster transcriptional repressor MraZ [Chloroflexi bacterium]|nr:division/cell wall cluster transcriptional repressor MraZ [Chloroflexota bacterium]MBI3741769.1 division/cell wall cluster transcriptional repressor MraZ [Chloroflexota bacterium]
MFLGSHTHSIDEKGRLTLPAKWRQELVGGVTITRGLDDCLFIFPKEKFGDIAQEIDGQPLQVSDARNWARYISGLADESEIDKQGRILLPQNLRNFAKLNGEVVVVGVVSRIEVWNPEKHSAINQTVESDANALAERLGQAMQRGKNDK